MYAKNVYNPYRFKVKEALRKMLQEKGIPQVDEFTFRKSSPRREVTITVGIGRFKVDYREHPLKEGWEIIDYKYTYANVESLKQSGCLF